MGDTNGGDPAIHSLYPLDNEHRFRWIHVMDHEQRTTYRVRAFRYTLIIQQHSTYYASSWKTETVEDWEVV